MAQGFKALNADGDILLSTEDDNQYFWIDNYTDSGVEHYGSGDATLAAGATSITLSTNTILITDETNVFINLSNDIFFMNIPSERVAPETISGYGEGGFIGVNLGASAIQFHGVKTDAGDYPWVRPRTMNNFAGAETGYGINVYNSGGKEGGQSELKWSSNAQGHLDIVTVGLWNSVGTIGGALYIDIPLKVSKGPYYVLLQNTMFGGSTVWYRAPCYEFRYPSSGDDMVIRCHSNYVPGASTQGTSTWASIRSVYGTLHPSGYYMIVRKRPRP